MIAICLVVSGFAVVSEERAVPAVSLSADDGVVELAMGVEGRAENRG